MSEQRPIIHSSEIVHENRWYTIRRDGLTWPNGIEGEYFVLTPPVGGSLVIAEDRGHVLIVEQYRHAIETSSIEFPKGGIKVDETEKAAAERELREETGLQSDSLTHIGTVFELSGAARYPIFVFATSNVWPCHTQETDETEFDLSARWVPLDEFRMMIRKNWIHDSATLAAWALYQEYRQERRNNVS